MSARDREMQMGGMDDMGADMDGDRKGGRKLMGGGRRKACRFCVDAEFVVDYKNTRILQAFVTEHGKMVPRRVSGNCADHQRKMTTAIKQARNLALMGFTTMGV